MNLFKRKTKEEKAKRLALRLEQEIFELKSELKHRERVFRVLKTCSPDFPEKIINLSVLIDIKEKALEDIGRERGK